jgi:hypothetical protein
VVEFEVRFNYYVSMESARAYLRIRRDSADVPVSLAGSATQIRVAPLEPLLGWENYVLEVGAGITSDTTERLGLSEAHWVNFTVR